MLLASVAPRTEYLLTLMLDLIGLKRARIQGVQDGALVELLIGVVERERTIDEVRILLGHVEETLGIASAQEFLRQRGVRGGFAWIAAQRVA